MRHLVSKPKLNRSRNQRRALVKNLLSDFFLNTAMVTTMAKAKFIKPQVEHSITIAKKGTLAAYRQLVKNIGNEQAVKKLVDIIAPSYTRTSGYTRLSPVNLRRGDNTLMVKLALVEKDQEVVKKAKVEKSEVKKAEVKKNVEKSVKKSEVKKETKPLDKKKNKVKSEPKTKKSPVKTKKVRK